MRNPQISPNSRAKRQSHTLPLRVTEPQIIESGGQPWLRFSFHPIERRKLLPLIDDNRMVILRMKRLFTYVRA